MNNYYSVLRSELIFFPHIPNATEKKEKDFLFDYPMFLKGRDGISVNAETIAGS